MKLRDQGMKDIEAQYPDEWVLLQVTRTDRHWRTSHGIVLGHGGYPDRDALREQERSFHESYPGTVTFLFWTGRLIPDGVMIVPPFFLDLDWGYGALVPQPADGSFG